MNRSERMTNVLTLLSALTVAGWTQGGERMPPPGGGGPEGRFEEMLQTITQDAAKQEKIRVIHQEKHKAKQKLHIQMEKKELELREMLLASFELPRIRQNCDERAKIWADLQYLDFEKDAEVKKILDDKEWDRYLAAQQQMRMRRQNREAKTGSPDGREDR